MRVDTIRNESRMNKIIPITTTKMEYLRSLGYSDKEIEDWCFFNNYRNTVLGYDDLEDETD